jgi:hypothetical protein
LKVGFFFPSWKMANEVGSAFGEEFTTIPNSSNTTTYMLATNKHPNDGGASVLFHLPTAHAWI